MTKEFLKQLDKIFVDNCKVLDAIDEGKNTNIQKALKSSLISNNRIIQVFMNYIKQYDLDEEVYDNDIRTNDPKLDNLKKMFGMK